jgi:hypothetical protein
VACGGAARPRTRIPHEKLRIPHEASRSGPDTTAVRRGTRLEGRVVAMTKSKLPLQAVTIFAPRSPINRRSLLKGVGSVSMAAPLAPLLACSSNGAANDNTGGSEGAGGPGAPPSS